MRHDEVKVEVPGQCVAKREVHEISAVDLTKIAKIRQIDDGHLPQSIKDLFRK
jgi:hypothetical protein